MKSDFGAKQVTDCCKTCCCELLSANYSILMENVLILPSDNLVASGIQRSVYLHPTDQTKLVKVLKSAGQLPQRKSFSGRMDTLFPWTRIRQIRKEFAEYLRVMLKNPDLARQPPISHMFGFVVTDKGLGCLTERVIQPDGRLGETLYQKVKNRSVTDEHLKLLNQTVKSIFESGIRAGDLQAKNLVFGHRYFDSVLGPEECVLVDGFGDTFAIPVRSLGRLPNRIGLDDSCKRLARKNRLNWDRSRYEFSFPAPRS